MGNDLVERSFPSVEKVFTLKSMQNRRQGRNKFWITITKLIQPLQNIETVAKILFSHIPCHFESLVKILFFLALLKPLEIPKLESS